MNSEKHKDLKMDLIDFEQWVSFLLRLHKDGLPKDKLLRWVTWFNDDFSWRLRRDCISLWLGMNYVAESLAGLGDDFSYEIRNLLFEKKRVYTWFIARSLTWLKDSRSMEFRSFLLENWTNPDCLALSLAWKENDHIWDFIDRLSDNWVNENCIAIWLSWNDSDRAWEWRENFLKNAHTDSRRQVDIDSLARSIYWLDCEKAISLREKLFQLWADLNWLATSISWISEEAYWQKCDLDYSGNKAYEGTWRWLVRRFSLRAWQKREYLLKCGVSKENIALGVFWDYIAQWVLWRSSYPEMNNHIHSDEIISLLTRLPSMHIPYINSWLIKSKIAGEYLLKRQFFKSIKFKNRLKILTKAKWISTILVARIWSIGDAIRSTSVIKNLKKKYPKAKISVLTSDYCVPIFEGNPNIFKIHKIDDFDFKCDFDWVINLQYFAFTENFWWKMTYDGFLLNLEKIKKKIFTWRTLSQKWMDTDTNILFNTTSQEQLFDIALLDWDKYSINDTEIFLEKDFISENLMELKNKKGSNKLMWIFLGSYTKWDYDNWFRTYSISYIKKLLSTFGNDFNIVIFWQSKTKSDEDIKNLYEFIKGFPNVINYIDKTSLKELFYIINEFDLLITSDSSPLHIWMARKIPTIWLFPNSWAFEISPALSWAKYSIINSFRPCSKHNYESKFFCQNCNDSLAGIFDCYHYKCNNATNGIPISAIVKEVNRLLDIE
ncbi:MAG: hypothetical protein ACD_3C00105G0010 [uncultured bacterium (gcode 4)]|uniref:Uncharacterized protein n=1 Tax=uncultured bacterium (gcode 4) TaxID=1234023 RepID=K2G1I5_9BACT|nr:MAG: hypothetical protein ACD_3C00105G0010 [uncultured bacterium (gcode 4)]